MNKTFRQILKIALPLTAICACVGLLLASVYALTAERIKLNEEKDNLAAVRSLFGECDEPIPVSDGQGRVKKLYLVTKNGRDLGYCAIAESVGFKDTITVAVAADTNGVCTGVTVTSIAETPGVGSKTAEDSFLSQYIGKKKSTVIGKDIDAVSGATISSRAVNDAVSEALSFLFANLGIRPAETTAVTEADPSSPETTSPTPTDPTSETVFVTEPIDVPDIRIHYPAHQTTAPESTGAPEETTGENETTSSPEETKPGEETTGAESTGESGETTSPEETKPGEETTGPETTGEQETTGEPETTGKPETTTAPETTAEPDSTAEPETTAAPETTEGPSENEGIPEEDLRD